jgi:hypothetical protein
MSEDLDGLSDQALLALYKQIRTSTGAGGASQKLTEDQGKAQTYARLMSDAETSYQRARDEGYDPSAPRNATASVLEGLPFGGLDGVGALVRDDVGDRARQAELQWSDAQLKALSGAASPEQEVKRNVRTFFPRPGEGIQNIDSQKTGARVAAFDSAKIRSGPAGEAVGPYVKGAKEKPKGWTAQLPPEQVAAAQRYKGAVGTPGGAKNPFVPSDENEYAALPSKAYFIHRDGSVRRKP